MNRTTVLSVVAGGVLALAAIAGVSAVALAAAPITPNDSTPTYGPPTATPTATLAATNPPAPEDSGAFARALQPGEALITAAQLRADVSPVLAQDPANEDAWIAESVIAIKCMADKGYYYDPLHHGTESSASDLSLQAFFGHTGAVDAYQWQDAGCHGLAVHETGNDNNH